MTDVQTEPRSFRVHGAHEAPVHTHHVEADGFVDAAFAYLERWAPGADGAVQVLVEDHATGERHCFTLDPDSGEAASCD